MTLSRQVIESEFKGVSVDMKPAFFESLNKEGRVNENNIIIESLANSFGSLQKQVIRQINPCRLTIPKNH
jgi:hypothetical protein